jgi:hypothetical protein
VVGTSGRVLNELTIKGLNDKTAGALDDDIKDNLDDMIERCCAEAARYQLRVVNGW